MAYNKAKEEYKWKVWKEQEEKKLRELGVSEEVIAELRDYDWNCFKQERNYKNHQMPDTDFIERTEDASGKWEIQQPVNVQDFIKSLDDNKLRKELQKLDQVTLYIILLKTFGYGTEEIGKLRCGQFRLTMWRRKKQELTEKAVRMAVIRFKTGMWMKTE